MTRRFAVGRRRDRVAEVEWLSGGGTEMEFETEAQRECYEDRIGPWMLEIFGDGIMTREDRPVIGVRHGSAFAQVGVVPWGDSDTTVTTRAYVVTDVELTPELLHYLLTRNEGMPFGAFAVDRDGDILFEHSIVGSTCDRKELEASVKAVLATADQYDDEIVERWGGRRALEEER